MCRGAKLKSVCRRGPPPVCAPPGEQTVTCPQEGLTDSGSRGNGGNPCGASAEEAERGEDPSAPRKAEPPCRLPQRLRQLPPLSSSENQGRAQRAPTLLLRLSHLLRVGTCQRGPWGEGGKGGGKGRTRLGGDRLLHTLGGSRGSFWLMVLCLSGSAVVSVARATWRLREATGAKQTAGRAVRTCRSPRSPR